MLYPGLNDALRSANRAMLIEVFFPFLRLLLTAVDLIRKARDDGKKVVNRGVKRDLVAEYPGEYEEDETIIWWPFTSTTTKISVLENPMFLGKNGPRTIFQIHTSYSVDIFKFSAYPEAERLLPPGIALRITGVLSRDASGLTFITCEDDTDAPALVT